MSCPVLLCSHPLLLPPLQGVCGEVSLALHIMVYLVIVVLVQSDRVLKSGRVPWK